MSGDRAGGDPDLVARAIGHPLRERVLFEYAEGVVSPSRVAAKIGAPVNLVSYHTGVLKRAGFVELVRIERRRGADEHFYRAVLMGEIEDADWERLPLRLRRAIARRALELIWRDVSGAVPRGGMDGATTHVSRTHLQLDEQGRTELAALLRRTLEAAGRIEAASRARADGDAAWSDLVVVQFQRASPP